MSDITLSDGREIEFDFTKVGYLEIRALTDPEQPDDEGDEIMARAIGWDLKEFQKLNYVDFRKLTQAFWKAALNPLSDPN